MADVLGLIAGAGRFPLDVARAARGRGRQVAAIAFHGQTDPEIESAANSVTWLAPGEVQTALGSLKGAGVRDAVMAGKVPKRALFDAEADRALDADASALLARLTDRRDETILRLVADHLESHGIHLLGQADLVPELLGAVGPLGRCQPDADAQRDIEFGWPIAKKLAGLDIGQAVVVKDGAVLAVEAAEGTDVAIARGGGLARGSCVIKVARPLQDPRFDLPAIGLQTVETLVAAGAKTLAFEAGQTVVLDGHSVVELADRHGIAIVGVDAESAPQTGSHS
jgi:hypothetical protein